MRQIPHIASDEVINTAGSSVTGIKTSAGTASTQNVQCEVTDPGQMADPEVCSPIEWAVSQNIAGHSAARNSG